MSEGVKKKWLLLNLGCWSFAKLKAFDGVSVETWLKELQAICLIQRPDPQEVWSLHLCRTGLITWQLNSIFIFVISQRWFLTSFTTDPLGNLPRANIWLLTSSLTMKPLPAELSHALLVGGPLAFSHNFVLIATSHFPTTTTTFRLRVFICRNSLLVSCKLHSWYPGNTE